MRGMDSEVAEGQGQEDSKETTYHNLRTFVAMDFLDRFMRRLPAFVKVDDDLIQSPGLIAGGLPDA